MNQIKQEVVNRTFGQARGNMDFSQKRTNEGKLGWPMIEGQWGIFFGQILPFIQTNIASGISMKLFVNLAREVMPAPMYPPMLMDLFADTFFDGNTSYQILDRDKRSQ